MKRNPFTSVSNTLFSKNYAKLQLQQQNYRPSNHKYFEYYPRYDNGKYDYLQCHYEPKKSTSNHYRQKISNLFADFQEQSQKSSKYFCQSTFRRQATQKSIGRQQNLVESSYFGFEGGKVEIKNNSTNEKSSFFERRKSITQKKMKQLLPQVDYCKEFDTISSNTNTNTAQTKDMISSSDIIIRKRSRTSDNNNNSQSSNSSFKKEASKEKIPHKFKIKKNVSINDYVDQYGMLTSNQSNFKKNCRLSNTSNNSNNKKKHPKSFYLKKKRKTFYLYDPQKNKNASSISFASEI